MRSILALAALSLMLTLGGAAAETLKFATALPRFGPAGDAGLIPWMRAVERDSGGDIKFEEFWGGQLIPNPTKEYDALANGVCDMTVVVTSFVQQQFPDSHLFEIPNVVHDAREAAYGGWEMAEKHMLRGMEHVYPAAVFANDPGGVHLAKPIKTLAALKGLKIRVSGPAEAEIVQILGAAPVGMNITDMAEGLSRGLYDGTFNGFAADRSFRVTPLLKAHVDLPMGVRQFIVAIHREVYDRLSSRARQAIDRNSGLALSLTLARAFEADGLADRADAEARGLMVPIAADERARLDAAFKAMLDDWIAKTPDGKTKYDFLEARVAEYRANPR